ncbi:uncharacterized protein LOC120190961 [Hibiscus syriacus]|uniref:uncharacterized protein LOC120190961 n=1 Tax=Hibiscus syriacus TaxID=106335 RepID=UPI001923FFD4|nr:uncharacterized protein LOC120190961 [Hibiscus syriacus]
MDYSSEDEEEFVSRTESVPAFLNSSPISNPLQSLILNHQNHPATCFDLSANFLNPFSQSDPNCSVDFGNLQGSSSSQGLVNQVLYPSSSTPMQSKPSHDNGPRPLTKYGQKSSVKNPNKRTRASRTAPTTVLTTDTMNFRAMVQEFTGIPARPFSGSSYSRRLDLFGFGSGMRSGHLETLGSLYPLCPSAKRVKPTSIASSSSPSLLTHPLFGANITNTTSNNTFSTSSNYYVQQPQNMLNLQNFQSFIHPPPLQSCLNLRGFAVSSHGSSALSSLDDLGLTHGNATAVGPNDGNQDYLRPLDWNYDSSDQNSQRV